MIALLATVQHVSKQAIHTERAPQAVGPYSQAIRAGGTVYLSGQVALDPQSGKLLEGDVAAQARQVFANLKAIATAANGSLDKIVRLTIYLTDIGDFSAVNEVMQNSFNEPYPARVTIGVAALPLGARVEADAIMVLD